MLQPDRPMDAFRLGRSYRLSHRALPRPFDSPSRSAARRAERIDKAADRRPAFRGQGSQTWLFPPTVPTVLRMGKTMALTYERRLGFSKCNRRKRGSILTVKKLFQGSADFWHIYGGDLPDDPQIDVGIVVSDDVAHAAHFSKGELWDGLAAR